MVDEDADVDFDEKDLVSCLSRSSLYQPLSLFVMLMKMLIFRM